MYVTDPERLQPGPAALEKVVVKSYDVLSEVGA
jgi:hypothetical protein